MIKNGNTAINSNIVIPEDAPVNFRIANMNEFAEVFADKNTNPSERGFLYDSEGERVCTEIAKELKKWVTEGRCPYVFSADYKDDGFAQFNFVQMYVDEFGNIYLDYEYIGVMS